ncbi:hypothetical protein D3C73_1267270 [compost metagenome]
MSIQTVNGGYVKLNIIVFRIKLFTDARYTHTSQTSTESGFIEPRKCVKHGRVPRSIVRIAILTIFPAKRGILKIL